MNCVLTLLKHCFINTVSCLLHQLCEELEILHILFMKKYMAYSTVFHHHHAITKIECENRGTVYCANRLVMAGAK